MPVVACETTIGTSGTFGAPKCMIYSFCWKTQDQNLLQNVFFNIPQEYSVFMFPYSFVPGESFSPISYHLHLTSLSTGITLLGLQTHKREQKRAIHGANQTVLHLSADQMETKLILFLDFVLALSISIIFNT